MNKVSLSHLDLDVFHEKLDNGFKVKGKLNISKINLECNILNQTTASSLEVAPGIFSIAQCDSISKQVEDFNCS